ncbi:MAG: tRNA guanosine(34) transglycosylase Tgt [Planctomycetes bacterium]|nr:tRNA guanosine(34) transglycosylase Tgt [Planctomycetota bacterium]
MPPLKFELKRPDNTTGARLGRVTTLHGSFDTPAFMPVGTQGTVKGLLPDAVRGTGAQIILGNTYHLMLRPGSELVAKMGGLQRWSRWCGPMLTDSGGFQVFSLADINRITDDGVVFKSHLDGATINLTPERSMQVQNELGADIIMAFDECPPARRNSPESGVQSPESGGETEDARGETNSSPSPSSTLDSGLETLDSSRLRASCERTLRWLDRCKTAHARPDEQSLFGIVQGGTDLELRSWCAQRVTGHDLPGYAIGGVAVGETFEDMKSVVEHTAPLLPADRPRYLMGVGYERDIVMAVRAGIDMFDCVLPTRNGRNAFAFTPTGPIRLRNAKHADDPGVMDPTCDCPACGGGYSRSYIRHLFMADEMLGPILVSGHNIRHFQRLMLDIRRAIADNDWSLISRRWPVAGL